MKFLRYALVATYLLVVYLAVVAFVQESRGRAILAAAAVPLKNARP